MNTKNLFGIILFFLCTINLVSCEKEEDDFLSKDTENSTVISGTVHTKDELPLSGVNIKIDYYEGAWLQYSLLRHKAITKTDKNGNYKLEFYVRDDELQRDENLYKYFNIVVNMNNLDPKQYILPNDMTSIMISPDPPIAKPATNEAPIISYHFSVERNKTYTQDFYIPQKRYVQITLKGFTPKQNNAYFEVHSFFPWGEESDEKQMIDSKYRTRQSGFDLNVASSEEQTFEVPFALNENNIVRLTKRKNGILDSEDHKIFVTKDSPKSLTYEY